MFELREIRANRLGITFRSPFVRDPFKFETHSLLLWVLYGITRPVAKAPPKLQNALKSAAAATAAPAPAPAPEKPAGRPWGNDHQEFIWPTRRYQE
jgi:hypothetical protein